MPLQRRIPKRGFTPRKRHVYQIVNLGELSRVEGTTVNAQTLRAAGLIRSTKGLIKVLAMGEVSQAYSVEAHKFSGGATAKIEAAGGSVTTLGPAVAVQPPTADPPVAEDPPAEADPPAVEDSPAAVDAPAVEDSSVAADPPVVEDLAAVEDQPVVEDPPAAEDLPTDAAEAENDG